MNFDFGKLGMFVGGVIFGTAGVAALASDDAKKCYTEVTAAALRAKDMVMDKATQIQENAEDIYAEAQMINDRRAVEKAAGVVEDATCDTSSEETIHPQEA